MTEQQEDSVRGRRGFFYTLFGGLLAALAGWVSGAFPRAAGAPQAPTPGPAPDESRISALEAEVARLAEQLRNAGAVQPLGELEGGEGERVVFKKSELTVTNPEGVLLNLVATRAMDLAIRKAKQSGVAGVWVRHGGDFMMTANHSTQALEHDQVGITMRNENPRVAPWGGREAFFFTNLISVAIPTAQEPPIVIDMAGGSASVGAVVMAARDARLLPTPQLVTADGVYTDDPRRIVIDPMDRESGFQGAIVTLGHKGLMWSLIVELFSGLLTGTNTSNQNAYEPTREAERRQNGIPIRDEDWEGVVKVATRLGVEVAG